MTLLTQLQSHRHWQCPIESGINDQHRPERNRQNENVGYKLTEQIDRNPPSHISLWSPLASPFWLIPIPYRTRPRSPFTEEPSLTRKYFFFPIAAIALVVTRLTGSLFIMPSSTSPEVRTFSPIVMECGESLNVPQPELSHQEESSPPPRSGITRDVDGRAIVTEDAMDVKETTDNLEDVYV